MNNLNLDELMDLANKEEDCNVEITKKFLLNNSDIEHKFDNNWVILKRPNPEFNGQLIKYNMLTFKWYATSMPKRKWDKYAKAGSFLFSELYELLNSGQLNKTTPETLVGLKKRGRPKKEKLAEDIIERVIAKVEAEEKSQVLVPSSRIVCDTVKDFELITSNRSKTHDLSLPNECFKNDGSLDVSTTLDHFLAEEEVKDPVPVVEQAKVSKFSTLSSDRKASWVLDKIDSKEPLSSEEEKFASTL